MGRDGDGAHANYLPSLKYGIKDRRVEVLLDGKRVLTRLE